MRPRASHNESQALKIAAVSQRVLLTKLFAISHGPLPDDKLR